MYQRQQGALDYLPNYASVFCYRPRVMQAWAELQRTIRAELDDRTFSLITLASALEIGSTYCALAHARKLNRHYFSSSELVAIIQGAGNSPLTGAEQAMLAVARTVARDSSSVAQSHIDTLREAGYSDAAIFDIVATAAARCFFAKVPDALGARPDAALAADMDDRLRALLTVGRPLAEPPTVNSNA
jgi:alkylhydroperoxidase family enzyme